VRHLDGERRMTTPVEVTPAPAIADM
jgi:hypothetical protein